MIQTNKNLPKLRFKDYFGELARTKLSNISSILGAGVDKRINENEIKGKIINFTDVFKSIELEEKCDLYNVSFTSDEYKKFKVEYNDILITPSSENKTDIGITSIINIKNTDNIVYSYHLNLIRLNNEITYPPYISLQLKTTRIKKYFFSVSQGVTRYTLSKNDFKNIDLFFPCIKEQEKIAHFLTLLSKQIDLWKKKMLLLERIYEYINNKILICDIFNSKFKLKDLCYIPKKEPINNYENFKKMTLKLHNQGIILLNEKPKKTKKGRPYFVRNTGELLIGKQNIHNRSFCIIPNIDNIYVTSNALMSLLPRDNFNLKQIYFLMRTNRWTHYVNSLNSATGQKEYSEKQILNFPLPYDDKNNKIVDVLDKISDLKNKISNYINYLNEKKLWFLNSMFLQN